jgi:hypothetical protein
VTWATVSERAMACFIGDGVGVSGANGRNGGRLQKAVGPIGLGTDSGRRTV